MKLGLSILFALTAFVFLQGSASAADPVVTGIRVVAPETLTVGDHFQVVIMIEADEAAQLNPTAVALPQLLSLTQPPQTTTRSLGNGRAELTLTLDLAAFTTGNLVIPPLSVAYSQASGVTGELVTPPAQVNVQSVLTQGDTGLRDLKPQAEIGVKSSPWLMRALLITVAGLLLIIALIIWRVRAANRPEVVDEPLVLDFGPEERARARLDAAGEGFLTDHDFVAYYTTIATTVRGYLTERFEFPAFAMTTSEMQTQMTNRGVDRWQARVTGSLLDQCDAVVYAQYRPAEGRADADLTAAYEIVEMSRPVPPEPEPELEAVGAST